MIPIELKKLHLHSHFLAKMPSTVTVATLALAALGDSTTFRINQLQILATSGLYCKSFTIVNCHRKDDHKVCFSLQHTLQ
jgi:hypothetical protein